MGQDADQRVLQRPRPGHRMRSPMTTADLSRGPARRRPTRVGVVESDWSSQRSPVDSAKQAAQSFLANASVVRSDRADTRGRRRDRRRHQGARRRGCVHHRSLRGTRRCSHGRTGREDPFPLVAATAAAVAGVYAASYPSRGCGHGRQRASHAVVRRTDAASRADAARGEGSWRRGKSWRTPWDWSGSRSRHGPWCAPVTAWSCPRLLAADVVPRAFSTRLVDGQEGDIQGALHQYHNTYHHEGRPRVPLAGPSQHTVQAGGEAE